MHETDLHHPIATYLTAQGYHVASEVRHCDMVATREDLNEPIILEFKTKMSLRLVTQGVRRQELSDSVYLVVPLIGHKASLPNPRDTKRLLRRLGLGLIVVRRLNRGTRVETLLHPADPSRITRTRARRALIGEIDGRYAELTHAGTPTSTTHYTAYRQQALLIAHLIATAPSPEVRPRDLVARGGPPKTGTILSANHYGWFTRVRRGWYRLSHEGHTTLQREHAALQAILDRIQTNDPTSRETDTEGTPTAST